MTRLAGATLATLFAFCLTLPFAGRVLAQDEKKPGKKPPPEKMDKDQGGNEKASKEKGGKDKAKGDAKAEAKPDGDEPKSESKAREPADEKQRVQFEKIRKTLEKQFRKGTSKREQVYVYVTKEVTQERIEPTEPPPQQQPAQQPPQIRGGRPGQGGGRPGGFNAGGVAAHAGGWELIVKHAVYLTKDADEGIEKVYEFLLEFPPPRPGERKKRGDVSADEPPPPKRELQEVKIFPATKEGERQAEAYQEKWEKTIRDEQHRNNAKLDRKKGKG